MFRVGLCVVDLVQNREGRLAINRSSRSDGRRHFHIFVDVFADTSSVGVEFELVHLITNLISWILFALLFTVLSLPLRLLPEANVGQLDSAQVVLFRLSASKARLTSATGNIVNQWVTLNQILSRCG